MTLQLSVLAGGQQAEAKLRYVQALIAEHVVAIGNGRNDRLMLDAAGLGIAVIQREGGAAAAILSADIVATSITDALGLLLNTSRLTATLRS